MCRHRLCRHQIQHRRRRGRGGRGGGGAGFGGGRGGGGTFGRTQLAQEMIKQGDSNKDEKLSTQEFTQLVENWFGKMDSEKTGKLNQEQFLKKLAEVLNLSPGNPQGQRSGGGAGGPTGTVGPRLFTLS